MTNIIFKRDPVIRESLTGVLCLTDSAFAEPMWLHEPAANHKFVRLWHEYAWICHETFRWRGAPAPCPTDTKGSGLVVTRPPTCRLISPQQCSSLSFHATDSSQLRFLDRHLFFQLSLHLSHLMSSCVILVKAVNVHNNRLYWSHALLCFVRTKSSLTGASNPIHAKGENKRGQQITVVFSEPTDKCLEYDYGTIVMDRQINRKRERERSMGGSLDGWTDGTIDTV